MGVSEKSPIFFHFTRDSNPGSLGCEPSVLPLHHVSEEQGGFRKGKGYIDLIFAMKRLVEEYLGKDKKCTQLLWISGRHTIRLTEKLSGVCCIYMVWVDSY